jgi:acetylornithine deacetylase/succinyl-diaminopimelate desuccinylase-like protein
MSRLVDEYLDTDDLVQTLSHLATVPTHVDPGFDTLIEPDHPRLVHYVQDVVRPELVARGYYDLLDVPRNNLVVRVGDGDPEGPCILIQNYTPAQHHNLMENPFSGKVGLATEFGLDEPCVFGQGVSQNKAHQAVMLAVLQLLRDADVQLRGALYWSVNNEGRSTHECTEAILAALPRKPDFCLMQLGMGMRASLGNRGRIDVNVKVTGKSGHSSAPQHALNVIEGTAMVLERLARMQWPEPDPVLGGRHAIIYKARYEPLLPHTIPSEAYLTVDRRMLPGDDPDEAVQQVRDAIGDLSPFGVEVSRGVMMKPAVTDAQDPWVQGLVKATREVADRELDLFFNVGAFDAGGTASVGIPTVSYGAKGGVFPLGPDFVPISAVVEEAKVIATLILDRMGPPA